MANLVGIGKLIPVSVYPRTYKTGSIGFFGKVVDETTGTEYQIQAVQIGSKPKTPATGKPAKAGK